MNIYKIPEIYLKDLEKSQEILSSIEKELNEYLDWLKENTEDCKELI